MAPRGRKPKPTYLKLVTNTLRKHRAPKNEPIPARAIPSMPPELSDDAKAEWALVSADLHRLGLLTRIDRAVLAAYCAACGRWTSAERELRLHYINSFRDRHGKTRHYFQRPGFKSVRLPGLPGSAEFMEAYQTALAGSTAPRLEIGASHSRPGSVAAAVALYLGSMDFGGLARETQRDRRAILERFREDYGERSFKGLEPASDKNWSC
jgi:phage terminase small subunit